MTNLRSHTAEHVVDEAFQAAAAASNGTKGLLGTCLCMYSKTHTVIALGAAETCPVQLSR